MALSQQKSSTGSGVTNALAAYFMWGLAPIYFKLLIDIGAGEILMHRVVWSSVFLLLLVLLSKKRLVLMQLCKQPKVIAKLSLSAAVLAVNWLIFIWAINNNHLLDASLGYFINPLFNVALGMIFFNERLRRNQKIAVVLAGFGVFVQLFTVGSLPLVSLVLASTFAIYGVLRKKMHVDSFVGLLIESLLMLPIAILYWLYFIDSSTADLTSNSASLNFTLIMAGIVTTAPLLCFTAAAKRLTLSSLGFFQYIGPSIMFLLATFYYKESMQLAEFATFIFIWLALALYSIDAYRTMKKTQIPNTQ
ncbi:EamA family transporter RarD [Colwellia sp. 4_MG-2023]|uniref:EamA family transporter RarD n=1 Tax=unclassified Colwellia TaxID=196834 RepID=UPI001C0944E7|nr:MULTISPECIES: EamA family transporter RarD [unclassified Colwellia]MBU2923785.1 EamA family transporter RarD [Colwellia sp. C2M11]MDO6505691.1 EamA family transporter RarD [Colwellia sp. 5_MG-2023]MDO6554372.1 EamA family transporter RarD [Colwellia sp. 4_MG-2023]MDO6654038.1 EamA family transporter RarD [Colwellia sp. 3_MG-2023]MDO6666995.1 EamA family transporter RarD [Colwellia sp. 2_MG-2023]